MKHWVSEWYKCGIKVVRGQKMSPAVFIINLLKQVSSKNEYLHITHSACVSFVTHLNNKLSTQNFKLKPIQGTVSKLTGTENIHSIFPRKYSLEDRYHIKLPKPMCIVQCAFTCAQRSAWHLYYQSALEKFYASWAKGVK